MLALAHPTHQVACERKEGGVHGRQGEEDTKVETDVGMQVEEELVGGLDDCGGEKRVSGLIKSVDAVGIMDALRY